METKELLYIAQQDPILKQYFKGVFPSDRLPKTGAFIANIDPHNKPGSHWVAFWLPNIYFDSYGRPPDPAFELAKRESWTWNSKRLQGCLGSACGQYCIYFLVLFCRGYTMQEIVSVFNSSNLVENDLLVKDFVNDVFDVQTKAYDFDFIVNQIGV